MMGRALIMVSHRRQKVPLADVSKRLLSKKSLIILPHFLE